MAIRFEDVDDDTLAALRDALVSESAQRLLADAAPLPDEGSERSLDVPGASTEELTAAAPHAVLSLGLDDLLAGRGLRDARRVATRVLICEGGRAIAATRVGASVGHATVHVGPSVEGVERAVERIDAELASTTERVTLSLLEIPSLQVTAVVAQGADGGSILALPLRPSPAWLTPDVPMPAQDFERQLLERARALRPFDSSPRPTRQT